MYWVDPMILTERSGRNTNTLIMDNNNSDKILMEALTYGGIKLLEIFLVELIYYTIAIIIWKRVFSKKSKEVNELELVN